MTQDKPHWSSPCVAKLSAHLCIAITSRRDAIVCSTAIPWHTRCGNAFHNHMCMDAMARMLTTETLGALIDKLAIVDLKLWHCQELLFGREVIPPSERQELEAKNASLLSQRAHLIETIDRWIAQAIEDPSEMLITSPQNKLYGRFRTDVEL